MRVGIIGAGAAAERIHLPGILAAGATFVGAASRSPRSAAHLCDVAGMGSVMTPEALFASADAIIVASPHPFHATHAIAAMRAGAHVLVEKPIATDLADVDEMLRVAAETDRVIGVAHAARFDPRVAALRRAIRTGGPVDGFQVVLANRGPRAWSASAAWQETTPGGVLLDLGVHCADLVGHLVGPVDAVLDASADDPIVPQAAAFRVQVGEAVGMIEVRWTAPQHVVDVQVDLAGETVTLDEVTPVEPSVSLHDAWLTACRGEASPDLPTGRDGRAALQICVQALALLG